MEDYPKTMMEFEKRFCSESACRKYLADIRWANGFLCPHCRNDKAWQRTNGLYECAGCGVQTSVTAGTIFQDTKLPLHLWFRAIWQITSQKYGANALGLQRILGLGSYRTAWSWLHKLRHAMIRPGRDRLCGVIQVDETYIGARKSGKRGRGASGKALVVIMAELNGRGIGRIRLKKVEDASAESLEETIFKAVETGAIIETDGWKSYNGLPQIGYRHEIVRKDAVLGDDLLPRCHRIAGLLKRWLAGTLQGAVSQKHLEYYLDEYTFRFNRRKSRYRGKLFYRLVENAVAVGPISVKSIIDSHPKTNLDR